MDATTNPTVMPRVIRLVSPSGGLPALLVVLQDDAGKTQEMTSGITVTQLEQEIDLLKAEVKKLGARNDSLRTWNEGLRAQIADLEKNPLAHLTAQMNSLATRLADLEDR